MYAGLASTPIVAVGRGVLSSCVDVQRPNKALPLTNVAVPRRFGPCAAPDNNADDLSDNKELPLLKKLPKQG